MMVCRLAAATQVVPACCEVCGIGPRRKEGVKWVLERGQAFYLRAVEMPMVVGSAVWQMRRSDSSRHLNCNEHGGETECCCGVLSGR